MSASVPSSRALSLRHLLSMLLLTLLCIGYSTFNKDKAYIALGKPDWCGIYCVMTKEYTQKLQDRSFDKYYFRKSIEAAIAHALLAPIGEPISAQLANRTLEFISVAALLGVACLWFLIARSLMLPAVPAWIGFVGICLGQTTLKVVPTVQESPDTFALLVGVAALYAYLNRKRPLLFFCFVVAGFTQHQLQLVLLPLVLLPWGASAKPGAAPGPGFWQSAIIRAAMARMVRLAQMIGRDEKSTMVWLFFAYSLVFVVAAYVFPLIQRPFHGTANEISMLMPFSIVLAAAVASVALTKLGLGAVLQPALERMTSIPRSRWASVAAVYAAQSLLTSYFGRGEIMAQTSTALGSAWVIYSFHYQAVEQPLKSLVAHIAYFGPLMAVVVLRWQNIAVAATRIGDTPLVLALIAMTVLGVVNSESRHFVGFLPWFAALALVGMPQPKWLGTALYFGAAALASRIYADYMEVAPDNDPFLMTWGPWFTKELYFFNLLAACALLAIGTIMMRTGGQSTTERRDALDGQRPMERK